MTQWSVHYPKDGETWAKDAKDGKKDAQDVHRWQKTQKTANEVVRHFY